MLVKPPFPLQIPVNDLVAFGHCLHYQLFQFELVFFAHAGHQHLHFFVAEVPKKSDDQVL